MFAEEEARIPITITNNQSWPLLFQTAASLGTTGTDTKDDGTKF